MLSLLGEFRRVSKQADDAVSAGSRNLRAALEGNPENAALLIREAESIEHALDRICSELKGLVDKLGDEFPEVPVSFDITDTSTACTSRQRSLLYEITEAKRFRQMR